MAGPMQLNKTIFSSIPGVNADLAALDSMHNVVKYDGHYYFMKKTDTHILVCDVEGLFGATTEGGTNRELLANTTWDWVNGFATAYGDDIFLVATYNSNETDYTKFSCFHSLDGGANWAVITHQVSSIVTKEQAVDIFKIGAQVYHPLAFSYGGTTYIYIYEFGSSTHYDLTFATAAYADRVIGGYVEDSLYHFFVHNPSEDNVYLTDYTFNGATVTVVGSTTVAVADFTTWNPLTTKLWKQKVNTILITKDFFKLLYKGLTVWAEITDVGSDTVALIRGYDADGNIIIKWIVWKDSIYKVSNGGAVDRLMAFTDNALSGWDDWIANGTDTIYQKDYTNFLVTNGAITNRIMNYPVAILRTQIQPFLGQWLELSNSAEEMVFQCRVIKDTNDQTNYDYKMITGIEEDFKVKITKSYVDKTIHYIIKDIIDNNFTYIWYGALIDDSNATTFTKKFNGQGFRQVLKWAAQYGGFVGSFTPEYELRLGAFIASGETIADNVNDYGYDEINFEIFHEKFSLIRLYGGFVNGIILTSVGVGEVNNGYWQDTFANITNQTELDGMRDQILADKNVTITLANFRVVGKDRLNPGDSFTYTSVKRSITTETWYFTEITLNIKNGEQIIKAADSFWLPHPTKNQQRDDKIDQNEQNIGAIETTVQSLDESTVKNPMVSDLDCDKYDLEDIGTIYYDDETKWWNRLSSTGFDGGTLYNTGIYWDTATNSLHVRGYTSLILGIHATETIATINSSGLTMASTKKLYANGGIEINSPSGTAAALKLNEGGAAQHWIINQSTNNNLYFYNSIGSNTFRCSSDDQLYCYGNVSALSFTDRTPICDLETAKRAINSLKPTLDGKIDHSKLDPFISDIEKTDVFDKDGKPTKEFIDTPVRDIGASVSANMLVIQDLLKRIEELEKEVGLK